MPAKGSNYKIGNRDQVIDADFIRRLKEETGLKLSQTQISKIIHTSNRLIRKAILDDKLGFKIPYGMGYWAVTKFKPKKRKAINWKDTVKYGKILYYNNLHTFGYSYRVFWFKSGISRFKFNEVYKFDSGRILSRSIKERLDGGEDYENLTKIQYWEQSRIERNLHKLYKITNNGDHFFR